MHRSRLTRKCFISFLIVNYAHHHYIKFSVHEHKCVDYKYARASCLHMYRADSSVRRYCVAFFAAWQTSNTFVHNTHLLRVALTMSNFRRPAESSRFFNLLVDPCVYFGGFLYNYLMQGLISTSKVKSSIFQLPLFAYSIVYLNVSAITVIVNFV